ncbi:SDR family NAD(P)-dependent oxidoreductase [Rhodobacterales bacterium HKCCE3408]|nr:SDR family NAD(P)-dependent oxidoreductase [Rhodobacterales bacterium HKCCE3408]
MSEAVVVGAGSGLSASLARALSKAGYHVTLAARDTGKLDGLAAETGAARVSMDATDPAAMAALVDGLPEAPRVAVYNPSARLRGPVAELDPEEVRRAVEVTAFGAFLLGREAARRMLTVEPENGRRGTILFTGASAGVKGFPHSAPFAMGKFAQRGLAQSMARELAPQGIHVAWINIDGGIANPERSGREDDGTDKMLDPDAIAGEYLRLIDQHRSAWTDELTLRPWVERY